MTSEHRIDYRNLPAVLLAASLSVAALAGCDSTPEQPGNPQPTASAAPLPVCETAAPQTFKTINAAKSAGKILYAANASSGEPHDIFEKDLHTGKATNLTNTPKSDELNPQLSPDHKQAVYAASNEKGNYQIFRIELGSNKVTQVTDHDANDFDPTYTPGGDILYKSNANDGYGDIWKMDSDGDNQRDLTPGMAQTEEWKPTAVGKDLVVFTSRHADDGTRTRQELANSDELMLIDTSNYAGEEPQQLTRNDWPDWYSEADPSRPGMIGFTSKKVAGCGDTLYEMNVTALDAEQQRKQLTDPAHIPGDSSDGAWAADGTLLFVNNAGGSYQAAARTPDGTYYSLARADGDVLSPIAVGPIKVA